MSEWYEVKDLEEIHIKDGDIDINFDANYNGNLWLTIPLPLMLEAIKKYQSCKKPNAGLI